MRTRARSAAIALLFACVVGASGCGNGDDSAQAERELNNPSGVSEPSADLAETANGDTAESAAAAPVSDRFTLGTHYERLMSTQPTSSSPTEVEVAEVFWYGCPHCYQLEPYVQRWHASIPSDVNFVRIPVTWDERTRFHARAFYTAEALDKVEEMHEAFFREIHDNGNPLLTEEALYEFFARFGVSEVAFKEAFDSPSVTRVKLGNAADLNSRYGIDGVPTLVVNGKYVTGAGLAGGPDALFDLVDELVAAERAVR